MGFGGFGVPGMGSYVNAQDTNFNQPSNSSGGPPGIEPGIPGEDPPLGTPLHAFT